MLETKLYIPSTLNTDYLLFTFQVFLAEKTFQIKAISFCSAKSNQCDYQLDHQLANYNHLFVLYGMICQLIVQLMTKLIIALTGFGQAKRDAQMHCRKTLFSQLQDGYVLFGCYLTDLATHTKPLWFWCLLPETNLILMFITSLQGHSCLSAPVLEATRTLEVHSDGGG